jgi:aspartate--ammonia ligase
MILHKNKFPIGTGIYTDMNAIRRDEDLSPIHSYYVDQWDWELVIDEKERSIDKLKSVVKIIYKSLINLEKMIEEKYPSLKAKLPKEIVFVTTQELEDEYPELTAKERENEICKKQGAVFLMQVGKKLKSGSIHDSRAPDYDDWELNGDILVYYDVLDMALELSSMGIRVDSRSLVSQLQQSGKEEYMKYEYHQMIESNKYPFTIGGGIGQSRICMFILNKLHVGEVQSSIWSDKSLEICKEFGIELL